MAESPLKDWKSKYLASVKEVFQGIEEHASCLGKIVGLEQRYPRLRCLQVTREEGSTIPYSGTLLEQAEVTKSLDRYSPSNVQDLFVPDGSGFVPKTLVLVGPHGIGKTMTSQKIMLDWASGSLYADTFNFVFYLSGKEINKIEGNVNIAGLVAKSSKIQCSEGLIKSAFNDPSKVLLVFDGFDELRWTLDDDYEDYDDHFQETHKETFLRCLFSKEILAETSMIITTRSMCLRKMKDFAQSPCSIELLGFSDRDLQQYFHHFFENKDEADQAVSVLKENEVLMGLCSVPLTCWLVCTILKAGMKSDLSSANCKTLTSVYLLYLESLLMNEGNKKPVLECLKKLCALANEGILNQKSSFDVEDLGRHGLTTLQVASVFLKDRILHKDAKDSDYSFIHLSVQEFFAALYYVLGEDAEVKEMNGASGDTFLPKVCKERSLWNQSEHHPHLSSTVRFLFGLLNEKRLQKFACGVGSNASVRAKSAMEKWLTAGKPSRFCIDALACVYEAQDEELRRGVFNVQDLVFQLCSFSSAMVNVCTREMLYCLAGRESFDSIILEDHLMRPKDFELLSPLFHRSSKLSFVRCGFGEEDPETGGKASWLSNPGSKIQQLEFHVCVVAPSFFEGLRSLISSSQSLTKLVIGHHKLEDAIFKILCDSLRQPGCTLRELELNDCNLTATSCEHLGSALKANRSLHKLDLALNELKDEGVMFLCEGLKDPGCTLQELRIEFSELTPACCDYFHSFLMTNRTLTNLYLRECNLQDKGAKRLCEALCHPGCILESLWLFENNITSSSCEDFRLVLQTNRTLTTLDLTYNSLQDSGVMLLCEGLRDPGCTLQKLLLSHCELTPASCDDLRSVLITNRSLTKLQLTWNELGDSGVKALCEGLRDPHCTLQELDLSGCGLSSSSLEKLTSVINKNRSLTKLDLSGNKYEDVGVERLCEALREPGCKLEELRVGYCEMTASCAEEFLAVINTNKSLKELDVSFAYEEEEPPADLDLMCRRFEHPACTLEKNNTQDGLFIYFKYRKPE